MSLLESVKALRDLRSAVNLAKKGLKDTTLDPTLDRRAVQTLIEAAEEHLKAAEVAVSKT